MSKENANQAQDKQPSQQNQTMAEQRPLVERPFTTPLSDTLLNLQNQAGNHAVSQLINDSPLHIQAPNLKNKNVNSKTAVSLNLHQNNQQQTLHVPVNTSRHLPDKVQGQNNASSGITLRPSQWNNRTLAHELIHTAQALLPQPAATTNHLEAEASQHADALQAGHSVPITAAWSGAGTLYNKNKAPATVSISWADIPATSTSKFKTGITRHLSRINFNSTYLNEKINPKLKDAKSNALSAFVTQESLFREIIAKIYLKYTYPGFSSIDSDTQRKITNIIKAENSAWKVDAKALKKTLKNDDTLIYISITEGGAALIDKKVHAKTKRTFTSSTTQGGKPGIDPLTAKGGGGGQGETTDPADKEEEGAGGGDTPSTTTSVADLPQEVQDFYANAQSEGGAAAQLTPEELQGMYDTFKQFVEGQPEWGDSGQDFTKFAEFLQDNKKRLRGRMQMSEEGKLNQDILEQLLEKLDDNRRLEFPDQAERELAERARKAREEAGITNPNEPELPTWLLYSQQDRTLILEVIEKHPELFTNVSGNPNDSNFEITFTMRRSIALQLSTAYLPGEIGNALLHMAQDPTFWAILAATIAVEIALAMVPDPTLITKIAAGAFVATLIAIFGVDTVYKFAVAWDNLNTNIKYSGRTADSLERIAKQFARELGPAAANILLAFAFLLLGKPVRAGLRRVKSNKSTPPAEPPPPEPTTPAKAANKPAELPAAEPTTSAKPTNKPATEAPAEPLPDNIVPLESARGGKAKSQAEPTPEGQPGELVPYERFKALREEQLRQQSEPIVEPEVIELQGTGTDSPMMIKQQPDAVAAKNRGGNRGGRRGKNSNKSASTRSQGRRRGRSEEAAPPAKPKTNKSDVARELNAAESARQAELLTEFDTMVAEGRVTGDTSLFRRRLEGKSQDFTGAEAELIEFSSRATTENPVNIRNGQSGPDFANAEVKGRGEPFADTTQLNKFIANRMSDANKQFRRHNVENGEVIINLRDHSQIGKTNITPEQIQTAVSEAIGKRANRASNVGTVTIRIFDETLTTVTIPHAEATP